ncbi:MAG: protein kinase [Deltaproteobacteria bacterium]|nr:protein kinase [Deltaproteobacteria bacterium]
MLESDVILGGLRLACTGVRADDGGPGAEIVWHDLTGLAGVPLDAGRRARLPAAESAAFARDRLYLVGDGVAIPLHPLVAYVEDETGREAVGFLNRTSRKTIREADGKIESIRRADYLDYLSGDNLKDLDAREAVTALLGRLQGRSAGPSDLQAAEDASLLEHEAGPEEVVAAGDTIGDFQLLGEIGRGAMTVVYRAWQRSLGRELALKVLPPSAASDPILLERFRREIAALGRCDHPNVVKILTSGVDQQRCWYAMELVDGADLSQVGQRLSGTGRGPTPGPDGSPLCSRRTFERDPAPRSAADGLRDDRRDLVRRQARAVVPRRAEDRRTPAPVLAAGDRRRRESGGAVRELGARQRRQGCGQLARCTMGEGVDAHGVDNASLAMVGDEDPDRAVDAGIDRVGGDRVAAAQVDHGDDPEATDPALDVQPLGVPRAGGGIRRPGQRPAQADDLGDLTAEPSERLRDGLPRRRLERFADEGVETTPGLVHGTLNLRMRRQVVAAMRGRLEDCPDSRREAGLAPEQHGDHADQSVSVGHGRPDAVDTRGVDDLGHCVKVDRLTRHVVVPGHHRAWDRPIDAGVAPAPGRDLVSARRHEDAQFTWQGRGHAPLAIRLRIAPPSQNTSPSGRNRPRASFRIRRSRGRGCGPTRASSCRSVSSAFAPSPRSR